jgi:hypothetical protein
MPAFKLPQSQMLKSVPLGSLIGSIGYTSPLISKSFKVGLTAGCAARKNIPLTFLPQVGSILSAPEWITAASTRASGGLG